MTDQQTIFALATPPGRSGVAVVRVSGHDSGAVTRVLTGTIPDARRAVLRTLKDPTDGSVIDRGLVLWFPGPASFTGEDVAEFHVHGGSAVVAALLGVLSRQPRCRPAEPGEFTRRAFRNGQLDLTEVEGLADLIDAQTQAQRRQAQHQFSGGFAELIGQWREVLVRALAFSEAALDFPDEDLPESLDETVLGLVRPLREEIVQHLADGHRGERLREGARAVIVGAPNAGKSSLLNCLAQRPAAIVSDIAGTTRDAIEVPLEIAGVPVTLTDTAGLRDSDDLVEAEGIRRARQAAESADLVIEVVDATDPSEINGRWSVPVLRVINKIDRNSGANLAGDVRLSAQTGDGVDTLLTMIGEAIGAEVMAGGSMITRVRHRVALEESVDCLERALIAGTAEMQAEDLRLAMRALGRVTGQVDVEDLLDVVFAEFCIGK